jgi:pyruvate dehydrogenase E1 component
VWEAIADPATQGLGDVTWIVDLNRQSLDRVVPGRPRSPSGAAVRGRRLARRRGEVRPRLQARRSPEPGGEALRDWIDAMPNEHYQALFGSTGRAARALPRRRPVGRHLVAAGARRRAGGARHRPRRARPRRVLEAPPGVRRGDGPAERRVRLHGQGLGAADRRRPAQPRGAADRRADRRAARRGRPHARRPSGTGSTRRPRRGPRRPTRGALRRPGPVDGLDVEVPTATGLRGTRPVSPRRRSGGSSSTCRATSPWRAHLVTTAPDVATSTNLAGFINRVGVFAPEDRRSFRRPAAAWDRGPERPAHRARHQRDEPVPLLGQLGLSWDLSQQPLHPDRHRLRPVRLPRPRRVHPRRVQRRPLHRRGHPVGGDARPEGGAHQSTITAVDRLELPASRSSSRPTPARSTGCCATRRPRRHRRTEPVTAAPADGGGAYYLRLTTRPIDQAPFEAARARLGDAVLRRQVLAGGYRLVDASELAEAGDAPGGAVSTSPRAARSCPRCSRAAATARRRGGRRARRRHHLAGPALPSAWQRTLRQGVRTATAPSIPGCAALLLPGPRAGGDRARRGLARAGWLGSALGVPACRSASTRSGSRGRSTTSTSCTTCCPARSSTPPSPRWRRSWRR